MDARYLLLQSGQVLDKKLGATWIKRDSEVPGILIMITITIIITSTIFSAGQGQFPDEADHWKLHG